MNKICMKRLLSLAVPIMISNLILQLQMVIDRAFLGHADSLYMSALGNVITPMWASLTFSLTLSTGASILISQAVGASDRQGIEEYAGALLKYNNVIPVALFFFWFFFSEHLFRLMGVSPKVLPLCVDYARHYAPVFLLAGLAGAVLVILQTSNYTKPLVVYGITRSALNIFLDWAMIFGHLGFPAMGIRGAAIATAIAEYVGGFFILGVFVFSRRLGTKPSFAGILKAGAGTYLRSARLGINTALEDLFWNVGNMVLISILNTINEMAAGIYSIIFGIELLAVVIVSAIGTSTMTLTSEAWGRKDRALFKGAGICAYILCVAVALGMLLMSVTIPGQVLSIFTPDRSLYPTLGVYLILISFNLFGKSANIVTGNCIRGTSDTGWMLKTQIFGTVWVVSVASVLVFVFKAGIAGVFVAVIIDELTRAAINLGHLLKKIKMMEPAEDEDGKRRKGDE